MGVLSYVVCHALSPVADNKRQSASESERRNSLCLGLETIALTTKLSPVKDQMHLGFVHWRFNSSIHYQLFAGAKTVSIRTMHKFLAVP